MISRRPTMKGPATRPGARARRTSTTPAPGGRLKGDAPKRAIVIGSQSKPAALSMRAMAIVFFVVLAFIIVTPSLNNYLDQQQQLRSLKASVEQAQQRNEELRAEVALWNDPEFVKIQARERLGYVMPGETLYTVTDPSVGSAKEQREALAKEIAHTRRASTPWFISTWDSITVAGYAEGEPGETVVPGDETIPQENK